MRDQSNHINPRVAIAPAAAVSNNTAYVSTALNLQGYDSATLLIMTGTLGTAGATFAVTLTEGNLANLSDQTLVTAREIIPGVNVIDDTQPTVSPHPAAGLTLASFTGASPNGCFKLGYTGNSQYIQATITPAGNAAAAFVSAVWLLGTPNVFPTPNPPV
jgi:hypothetical protein